MNWVVGSQEKLGLGSALVVEEHGQGRMQQRETHVTHLPPSCTSYVLCRILRQMGFSSYTVVVSQALPPLPIATHSVDGLGSHRAVGVIKGWRHVRCSSRA